MERVTVGGNFITRNLFLIFVFLMYIIAMAGPVWGLGWDSPALVPWTALVAAALLTGFWRYVQPGRDYPKTDLSLIVPVVVAVNLFAVLLGADGEWVRPMNYLLVALCALFYSVWFNFAVAGLVFLVEAANVFFAPGPAGPHASVSLGVYGAYLACIPLVLGRLFHSEYRKKERAISEYRRLTEGAQVLNAEQSDEESVRAISEDARRAGDVEATAALERGLTTLLTTARAAIPSSNAMMFMPDGSGEAVVLRLMDGDGPFRDMARIALGQGIIGWALKEKKPVIANNRTAGLDYLTEEGHVVSLLAVPMMDGGILEGIIALDSADREAFTESDRDALTGFSSLAIHMIKYARVSRNVGKDANKFETLHEVSQNLSADLDLPALMGNLPRHIKNIVDYDYLTISFVEGGKAAFKVVEGYGKTTMPKEPVAFDNTYLGWIIANQQEMSLSDFNGRTNSMPIFPVKELQADFHSFLGLPIGDKDGVHGVLTVALRESGGLSAYQHDMLKMVVSQLTICYKNAKLHQKITLMATTDGLTGLINHRTFQEKADERFSRAARFPENISLLLFDIDHFKKVNDTYGHPIGDAVLRKLSSIVKETARNIDVAARYGGEEFAVLMENTDEAGAMKMAERIRQKIEKTRFVFEGQTVPVTVSIGCACHPVHAADKKELIDRADKSLYWAKRNGRNRCCSYGAIAGNIASTD